MANKLAYKLISDVPERTSYKLISTTWPRDRSKYNLRLPMERRCPKFSTILTPTRNGPCQLRKKLARGKLLADRRIGVRVVTETRVREREANTQHFKQYNVINGECRETEGTYSH